MRIRSFFWVAIILSTTSVFPQSVTPTPPTSGSTPEQATIQTYLTSFNSYKLNPSRGREVFEVAGCEDRLPEADRDRGVKETDQIEQYALKQFPFVKIREYNGEKLVDRFRTPSGKLWADRRGIIRICIDPGLVADDGIYSQGDLSLSAQLGDRAVSVDGYAEVGKNYEKFKPSSLRPERFVIDYATIHGGVAAALADTDVSGVVQRAHVVSDVLATMLESSHAVYATTRITNWSEEELKDRAKALQNATKRFETVAKDSKANATQVDKDIDSTKARLAAIEAEILEAVSTEADLAANAASETKKREAARARTVELSGLHQQLRGDLKELQARKATLAAISAAGAAGMTGPLQNAEASLRSTIKRVGDLFALSDSEVAPRIYKFTSGLRPGQIFLRKEDAKRGDVLRVVLLHFPPDFKSDGTTASAVPLTQTLAEIYIDEFGWKTDVVDSFLLVKAGDKSVSNFKGAAGASLLWSPRPRSHRDAWYLGTIRGLRPSMGINVSYLDFDPSKEIEIGAGAVIGLFDNQMHFGYGWNLNFSGDDRSYFFIGFSFGSIKDKITGGH